MGSASLGALGLIRSVLTTVAVLPTMISMYRTMHFSRTHDDRAGSGMSSGVRIV